MKKIEIPINIITSQITIDDFLESGMSQREIINKLDVEEIIEYLFDHFGEDKDTLDIYGFSITKK